MAALVSLQYYKDAIKHQPSNLEYLEQSHMFHKVWSGFATYLCHNATTKKVKILQGKKAAENSSFFISKKVARTSTSTKDILKSHSCNKSAVLSITFGTAKFTEDKMKEVVELGEFINFKISFLHH